MAAEAFELGQMLVGITGFLSAYIVLAFTYATLAERRMGIESPAISALLGAACSALTLGLCMMGLGAALKGGW